TALLLLGGPDTTFRATLRSQWAELARAPRAGYEQLEAAILNLPPPLSDVDWNAVRDRGVELVTSARFGVGALAGVTTVVNVVTAMVFAVVLLFFFLKDGDQMWAFFTKRLAGEDCARAGRVGRTSGAV